MKYGLVVLLVAILVGIGWYWWRPTAAVTSYDECVAAGYPVMESYPPQCRASDGSLFVQEIGNELEKRELIRVHAPRPNATITSPVTIQGEARGPWFFEASFPIRVVDSSGNEIGGGVAQADGEWMSQDFVPFRATVSFSPNGAVGGEVLLEKSNPSGLPEQADTLRIPVTFGQAQTREVQIYLYDTNKDPQGNCLPEAITPVSRSIPVTATPIQDTLNLLLSGSITEAEKAQGLSTEFPLEGVGLVGANLESGTLTVELSDPRFQTSGGSCRTSIMSAQFTATATQFPQVSTVRFLPDQIFQP